MPESSRTNPAASSRVALMTSLLILCSAVTMAQSPTAERIIENKVPAHVPLKVKIKNLPKVKDLTNAKWLRDLEIEVTNTGSKPIYHFLIVVDTPDVLSPLSSPYCFSLHYGSYEFVDLARIATPEDVPLKPGESCTLKPPEREVDAWEQPAPTPFDRPANAVRIQVWSTQISFGDGTGFSTFKGNPFPRKKISCNPPPKSTDTPVAANAPPAAHLAQLLQLTSFALPVNYLPANFLATKSSGSTSNRSQSGLCCPGTQCYNMRDSTYLCQCGVGNITESSPNCAAPGYECGEQLDHTYSCTIGGVTYFCPEIFLHLVRLRAAPVAAPPLAAEIPI